MSMKKETFYVKDDSALYDARTLGSAKMGLLGLQHMFAMFGATVVVPAMTGLNVSTTLLFAGLGTLLFHAVSKFKVPAFLGSSFAFLAGYWAIAPNGEKELLPYACFGVACSGLLYLILAASIKVYGIDRVMRYFPPVVTGPIVIAIGMNLASSAIANCSSNVWIAMVAIVIIIAVNIWSRGMMKIVQILMGIVGSFLVAALTGNLDPDKVQAIHDAPWTGLPLAWDNTAFSIFSDPDVSLLITSVITIVPIALATMIEHIGDISAISSTVGRNYLEDPGLHRTLVGDGIATILASLFGGPANTTYGENTGVLTLTKVYDPRVIRLAALFAIFFSFSPKVEALITAMPAATIGGVSLILYGMISAVGVRNVVDNHVDFSKTRNVVIAAMILVVSIGVNYSEAGAIPITVGSMTISFSGLATGALAGIVLNVILPLKERGEDEDTAQAAGTSSAEAAESAEEAADAENDTSAE